MVNKKSDSQSTEERKEKNDFNREDSSRRTEQNVEFTTFLKDKRERVVRADKNPRDRREGAGNKRKDYADRQRGDGKPREERRPERTGRGFTEERREGGVRKERPEGIREEDRRGSRDDSRGSRDSGERRSFQKDRGGERREYSSNRGEERSSERSSSQSARSGERREYSSNRGEDRSSQRSSSQGARSGERREYSSNRGEDRRSERSSSQGARSGERREYSSNRGEDRRSERSSSQGARSGERKSFNPNFTENNRFIGERPERDDRRGGFNKREEREQHSDGRSPRGEYKEKSGRGGFEEGRKGSYGDRKPSFGEGKRDYKQTSKSGGRFEKRDGGGSRDERGGGKDSRGYRGEGAGRFEKRDGGGSRDERGDRRESRGHSEGSGAGRFEKRDDRGSRDERGGGKESRGYRGGERKSRTSAQKSYQTYKRTDLNQPMRLNRHLAMSGVGSRREADVLIEQGQVEINGVVVTELGTRVMPTDVVKYMGNIVQGENKAYVLMNKPKGYVTTVEDPHADRTVMDLLRGEVKERVYPVGRLDKNSLGVLLITNDGNLTEKLTHPSYNKKKVYMVTLDKPVIKSDMEQIVEGITLEDGEIRVDAISYAGESKREVGLEIHSGRNRIVRRIFEHFGYRVVKLDRVYFAGLTKKNLRRGEWRFLTPQEVQMLHSDMYE